MKAELIRVGTFPIQMRTPDLAPDESGMYRFVLKNMYSGFVKSVGRCTPDQARIRAQQMSKLGV